MERTLIKSEPIGPTVRRRLTHASIVTIAALASLLALDKDNEMVEDLSDGLIQEIQTPKRDLNGGLKVIETEDPEHEKFQQILESVMSYLKGLDNIYVFNTLPAVERLQESGDLTISYRKTNSSKSEVDNDVLELERKNHKSIILFDLGVIEREGITTDELAIKFLVLSSVSTQGESGNDTFMESIYWQVISRGVIDPSYKAGKITNPRLIELIQGELYTDVDTWLEGRTEDSIIHGLSQE